LNDLGCKLNLQKFDREGNIILHSVAKEMDVLRLAGVGCGTVRQQAVEHTFRFRDLEKTFLFFSLLMELMILYGWSQCRQ